jgi:hypothetical protein
MEADPMCQICCSNYNKSTRHVVKCYFPNCGYEACKECVRTYLTGITSDPHCMKCHNKWNIEFTKSALNASFMDKDYRVHRRNILVDTEIAKIPEYYEGALRFAKISDSDKKMTEIMEKIAELRNQISDLYQEHERVRIDMGNTTTVARKFVMQCQTDGCRGMLSSQYKCDLCSKYTCPKCFLAIAGEKDDHVCKQEDMDTVEELRKNTRPCPSCGMRISKTDGCDQMWCTECKTAFSWSKGTVERGVVHNPHYYQWMRENGRNEPQRNQCDHANTFNTCSRKISEILSDVAASRRMPRIFCDVFDITVFPNDVLNRKDRALKEAIDKYTPFYEHVKPIVASTESLEKTLRANSQYLTNFHRYIVHMEHVELRPLTESIQARTQNRNPIYRYILNYINRDLLADELIRTDTTTMKDRAYLDILDALVMVGKQILIDCMVELQAARNAQCLELYSKFDYYSDKMEYYSPKFISQFVVCEPVFPCEKMAEQFVNLVKITDKYVLAIRRYCAYSSIEALKFLLIYNSKKSLPLWNYFEGKTSWRGFQNKTEIQAEMKLHKEQLEEIDQKVEASSAGGSAPYSTGESLTVASSSSIGEGLSVASSLGGEGLQNTFV